MSQSEHALLEATRQPPRSCTLSSNVGVPSLTVTRASAVLSHLQLGSTYLVTLELVRPHLAI